MTMTPAGINLMIDAINRAERFRRFIALTDMRAALDADPKQANELLRKLKS